MRKKHRRTFRKKVVDHALRHVGSVKKDLMDLARHHDVTYDKALDSAVIFTGTLRSVSKGLRYRQRTLSHLSEMLGRLPRRALLKIQQILSLSPDFYVRRSFEQAWGFREDEIKRIVNWAEDPLKRSVFRNFTNKVLMPHLNRKISELNNAMVMGVKAAAWEGTRGAFANEIVQEYSKHQSQYDALKDCAFKMFSRYRFPRSWKWTKEKCYLYARNKHK